MNNKFRYYNHALVSNLPDHETLEFTKEELKEAFKEKKKALFLVYTSHFDCGFDSGYYYCINDQGLGFFDKLSHNHRKNLKSCWKYVECRIIDVDKYREDFYNIETKCILSSKQRRHYNYPADSDLTYVGAFLKGKDVLIGFKCIKKTNDAVVYVSQKVDPDYKKYRVSFALNWFVLEKLTDFSSQYVTNGTTNILHITNHHQFLVENLGFRYAYCKLNIIYKNVLIMSLVRFVSVFKPLLKLFRKSNFINNIYGVVELDSIFRKQRKMFKNV